MQASPMGEYGLHGDVTVKLCKRRELADMSKSIVVRQTRFKTQ